MDVSVDCALFGFDGESLKLLLIRQRTESAGELTEAALQMALPGNLVDEDESLDAAAKRVLSELTQLEDVFLKQFHAFGNPDRVSDLKDQQWLRTFREEPQNRVMTVAYYGLVSLHDHTPSPASFAGDVHWTDVRATCPTWPLTTTTSRRWHLPPFAQSWNPSTSHLSSCRKNSRCVNFNLYTRLCLIRNWTREISERTSRSWTTWFR